MGLMCFENCRWNCYVWTATGTAMESVECEHRFRRNISPLSSGSKISQLSNQILLLPAGLMLGLFDAEDWGDLFHRNIAYLQQNISHYFQEDITFIIAAVRTSNFAHSVVQEVFGWDKFRIIYDWILYFDPFDLSRLHIYLKRYYCTHPRFQTCIIKLHVC
jgi:hypothetical protein